MCPPTSTNRHADNSSRNYVTGLVFIVLVAVIWAASSVLIQYIYTSNEYEFHSPFLVTYIGVSLFTLWLPTHKILSMWTTSFSSDTSSETSQEQRQKNRMFPGSSGVENVVYQSVFTSSSNPNENYDNKNDLSGNASNLDSPLHSQRHTLPPNGLMEFTGGHEPKESAEHHTTRPLNAIEEEYNSTIDNENPEDGILEPSSSQEPWTELDHVRVAAWIAPVWFLANWTYNASLAYTSISSSTVLASTGSLFTYLFAILTNDERYTLLKVGGVLMGVMGSILTARNDAAAASDPTAANNDPHSADASSHERLLGDTLGLISAIGYGAYAVQTRVFCPSDESLYSMQLLLGYIGILNMVVLSPLAMYLIFSGTTHLPWIIVGFLIVKGLLDNVLSDYLWLRAVMLTNATTATVGLGLTIPLAFASDVFIANSRSDAKGSISVAQVTGALAVLVGFVLVNLGNTTTASGVDQSEQTEHQPLQNETGLSLETTNPTDLIHEVERVHDEIT